MKLYTISENYIRRQQWTNFLTKNRYSDCKLVCWFVGPETRRVIGIYCLEKDSKSVYLKTWRINEDHTLEYDDGGDADVDEVYANMSKSPEMYCTEYMAYFTGITSNPPAESDRKVLSFMTKKELPEYGAGNVLEAEPEMKAEKESVPETKTVIISVMPGEPLPNEYPDYRPLLQRDGLILLCWSVCKEDGGIRAYWASSTGRFRHFNSHEVEETELSATMPEKRTNWHWENDIEADYAVYAAPQGLSSFSRDVFIAKLREAGVTVDFEYDFSLGKQKMEREAAVLAKIGGHQITKSDNDTCRQLNNENRVVVSDFQNMLDDFLQEMEYKEMSI
jgi:hypothetical protein